jgi:hypothetical protein
VNVNVQVSGPQLLCLRVLGRLFPRLRVGQEELHDLGAPHVCGAERVVVADMGTYAHDQRA